MTFTLIHELAHGITAIIFGGKFNGIWLTSFIGFGKKSDDISAFAIYTYTSYNGNILCYRCVKIAGSLIAIITASIVNRVSKKKENITLFLATSNVIYYELFYWALSPLLKYGDAYQFFSSFEMINPNIILLFSFILIGTLICTLFILNRTFIRLLLISFEN